MAESDRKSSQKSSQKSSMADLLSAHRLFAGLPEAMIDTLAGCSVNIHAAPGAYVFRTDEPADYLYLIRAGGAALELRLPGRSALVVQTLHAGDVLGASWILPPYRWYYDARAIDDLRAIKVDAACLRGKCDADPATGYAVMQRFLPVVAQRLQATRLQLIDSYAPPAEVGAAL